MRWRIPSIILAVLALTCGAGWPAWQARQQRQEVAAAITGGDADRAPALLRQYGCGGCHAIPGVPGAAGRVGPPLQGLRERVYIAGVLPNTAENLVAWLQDPRRFSPRTAMPATGITPPQARDVAAFLYR